MAKFKNKARCKACGDVIESKFRHDFQQCQCGKVFVDGGLDYQRIGFPEGKFDDHIEIIKEEIIE